MVGGYHRPLGGATLLAQKPRILLFTTQDKFRLTDDAGINFEWNVSFDYTVDVFRVKRTSGTLDLYINNVLQSGSKTGVTSSFVGFKVIGGNYGISTIKSKFKSLKITVNAVQVLNLDATASDHSAGSQPVLIDTVGGNNATGVNFPTDGSAWVNLGGGVVYDFSGLISVATNTTTSLLGDKTTTAGVASNSVFIGSLDGHKNSSSPLPLISTENTVLTGRKLTGSTISNSYTASTTTDGSKSALGAITANVTTTFTVSGSVSTIIARSGALVLNAIATTSTLGSKQSTADISSSSISPAVFNGQKSALGSINNAAVNNWVLRGVKTAFGYMVSPSVTTVSVYGYADGYTPAVRQVTINGLLITPFAQGVISNPVITATFQHQIIVRGTL